MLQLVWPNLTVLCYCLNKSRMLWLIIQKVSWFWQLWTCESVDVYILKWVCQFRLFSLVKRIWPLYSVRWSVGAGIPRDSLSRFLISDGYAISVWLVVSGMNGNSRVCRMFQMSQMRGLGVWDWTLEIPLSMNTWTCGSYTHWVIVRLSQNACKLFLDVVTLSDYWTYIHYAIAVWCYVPLTAELSNPTQSCVTDKTRISLIPDRF